MQYKTKIDLYHNNIYYKRGSIIESSLELDVKYFHKIEYSKEFLNRIPKSNQAIKKKKDILNEL